MTDEGDHKGRRKKLEEALRQVKAMNGSPDIIQSLCRALDSLPPESLSS